jgi:phosphoglycolate phosphatase
MNRLAIFDCDGTLVDSGATIHRALVTAFEAHGLDCPPPSVSRKVIGLSLVEAMAVLAPQANHEALSRTYKEAFFNMRQGGHVEEPLFQGILPLLDALEAEGWLLAVATGKSDRGLRHCLESHGIQRALRVFADRRPAPEQAASRHGAGGDRRSGRGAAEKRGRRRYQFRHSHGAGGRSRGDRRGLGIS